MIAGYFDKNDKWVDYPVTWYCNENKAIHGNLKERNNCKYCKHKDIILKETTFTESFDFNHTLTQERIDGIIKHYTKVFTDMLMDKYKNIKGDLISTYESGILTVTFKPYPLTAPL